MITQAGFFILLALLISWLFLRTGRRGPGPVAGLLFFFLIFVLTGWAASLWIVPSGPAFFEIYWTGPLVVTILLALILFAVIPGAPPRRGEAEEQMRQARESTSETRTRHAIEFGFTAFFWIAVIGLLAVIVAGLL